MKGGVSYQTQKRPTSLANLAGLIRKTTRNLPLAEDNQGAGGATRAAKSTDEGKKK